MSRARRVIQENIKKAGDTVVGPPGPEGPAGPQGERGEQGPQGEAGSFTLGAVNVDGGDPESVYGGLETLDCGEA